MRRVKVHLLPLGLILEEEGKVTASYPLGETIDLWVKGYLEVEEGKVEDELLQFFEEHLKEAEVETSSLPLYNILSKTLGAEYVKLVRPSEDQPEDLLLKAGLAEDREDASERLREALLEIAAQRVKRDLEERDKIIVQAVDASTECTEIVNKMYERLREWYGIHFPELERHIKSYEAYVKIVSKLFGRENFSKENLLPLDLDEEKASKISKAARRSMGADLEEEDLKEIRDYASTLQALIGRGKALEAYVDSLLQEYAPNLTTLIGSKLAGLLISKAGGLRRLASMPASTIQLLGAEKALFRALRKGGRPPKHGLIFQHPTINQAPRWVRGKVARALASKIAIAARLDVYGGEDMGEKLKGEFEERVEEILQAHPKPPVKPRARGEKRQRRGKRRRKR